MPVGVAELVGRSAGSGAVVAAVAVDVAVAVADELQPAAAPHCVELANELVVLVVVLVALVALVAAVHVPAFVHSDEFAVGLVVNGQVD